ncbi:MAG: type II secretion system F family protein [Acetatifactor sp.]|nr:type II secretion system F family protein [Acetatifactor sp.]
MNIYVFITVLGIIIVLLCALPDTRIKEENQYEFLNKGMTVKRRREYTGQTEKIWSFVAKTARRFEKIKLPVTDKKRETIEKNIIYAGLDKYIFPEDIVTVKYLTLVVCGLYFGFLAMASKDPLNVLLGAMACALSFFLPETMLKISAGRRQEKISREFPAVITSLAIITDAGLNLITAIETLVNQQRDDSVFVDELHKALDEIKIGIPQKDAFLKLSASTNVEEVRFFVSALIQGLEKGSAGLTEIIRNQANESWNKRKLHAKELAEKASIKLFLPLLLLVFPAFAIFLMGPMVFSLIDLFSIF